MATNGLSRNARRRRNAAGGMMRGASSAVSTILRGGLETLREQAGTQAAYLGEFIRDQGDRFLRDRKERVADELSNVGRAIRVAADKLLDNDEWLGGYVNTAAAGVERTAKFIGRRDLAELGQDFERFARRHPAAVLGGLFAVGLVAGRFARAGLTDTR